MDGRTSSSVVSETVTVDDRDSSSRQEARSEVPVLTLRVSKTKTGKKVKWTEGTVDNEHLNRRKSKCCCIYDQPKPFGESSSDSDEDECDNCFGHVEKKKKKKSKKPIESDPEQQLNNDNSSVDKAG